MRYNKKPPPRTDDESGADSRTLGSSAESDCSLGAFEGQYSDTTDCEPATPTSGVLNRIGVPIDISSRPRAIDNVRTPLLRDSFNYGMYGYTKEPNPPEQIHQDVSYSSAVLLESSYKITNVTKNKNNSLITIFAVWNTIMGSSLLTMAWGIERAGLLTGVLLTVLMGGLCFFTAYTLLNVCYHHSETSSYEVQALCRILLGRWAEVIARISSLLVMLGANIVYWVLMTNFLYYSVKYFNDVGSMNATYITDPSSPLPDGYNVICPKDTQMGPLAALPLDAAAAAAKDPPYWGLYTSVPLYITLIIFPLLNFKNATFFTKFNSLGTLSVVYLVVFVVVKGWAWGVHAPADGVFGSPRVARDAAILSGMLALSFYIHNIIITIMRNNKHQHNNGRDLCIAFSLVTITYILVGAVFYLCFPLAKNCIEDNILNNFAKGDIMSAVARVLLFFQVVTVYPLIAYMFREQILELIPNPDNTYKRWQVVVINVGTVCTCVLFSCFCPRIGNIIRYTGALSGLVHVFALPAALQAKSLHLRGKLTVLKASFYLLILVIGAVNLFAQFFVSDTGG